MEHIHFMEWKDEVRPAVRSKREEFHYMGYESVTDEEIWNCVLAKLKKKKEDPRLHTLVDYILSLSLNDFMTWLTIQSYKADVKK
ncbi:post-transcriptional regulator [Fictibacillus phosphorivorans]|uniref:post-transcriptional regulator n=1 Tax=Fictibacillus phosphorivorans TaxID=1221500 RepID=UPI00203D51C9|nr:post-transcriptional regulator [Fictibacillus phosphorivorans]MCM3774470.1 post-transcriptional regulator [Fictibacillus phosphorivorans]